MIRLLSMRLRLLAPANGLHLKIVVVWAVHGGADNSPSQPALKYTTAAMSKPVVASSSHARALP